MKNLMKFLAILGVFLPVVALGQNQGDATPLGSGGTKIFCNANEAQAATSSAGALNFPACDRFGQLVSQIPTSFALLGLNDAAETGSTTTNIIATAHALKVGDMVVFGASSGTRMGLGYVTSIATNSFTITPPLRVAPNNGDFFYIARPSVAGVDTNNSILASLRDAGGSVLAQAEDSASSNGQGLIPVGSIREDALTINTNASGDWTPPKTDSVGRTMIGQAPQGSMVVGCNTAVTTATTGSMIAAVASNFTFITSWNCTNTGATASRVILEDGDGTDLANLFLPATTGFAAITFPSPVRTNVVNKAIQINVITSGSSTICCASGFTGVA